ncbi:hypothetical protein SUGI_0945960 [Cryptomeria japonica]|nr:hypothetical protein SUGI_0945960 [Cryptomeria japonica]
MTTNYLEHALYVLCQLNENLIKEGKEVVFVYVASNNEVVGDDVGGTPSVEMDIGIDLGTYECHVAVWRVSKIELLQNLGGQMMMLSCVLFQGDTPSTSVISNAPYYQP